MIWKSKLLSQFDAIDHGSVSSKKYGVTAFGYASDEEVIMNREKMSKDLGFELEQTVFTFQSHGNDIIKVDKKMMGRGATEKSDWLSAEKGSDAMITDEVGPVMVIRTADCIPIFFFHPQKNVIAVAHAGWKGTNKKIVQEVVKMMKDEYNCYSSELFVAIGPAICGQCYDNSRVSDDRINLLKRLFNKDNEIIIDDKGSISLNLPLANKKLCLSAGIPENQIEMSNICTYENDHIWASYRKNSQDLSTSIWSYIRLK